MSVNCVHLLGRLGQDPELKYTPSQTPVCNFSMATSESWKDKNGKKQERTEWHRVVIWGALGELCSKHLSKGSQAFVEGELRTRKWEDKEGKTNYTTEVIAKRVEFVGGFKATGESHEKLEEKKNDYQVASDPSYSIDDIPF